ncbi:IS5 family transposase [Candidatus Formimonas warabiya]|uniref:DDE transposase n=1 Tax=Formimonas warabiya TaxID=1761012 RepID=A0A3G1L0K8_FORW1|nr:IS5 family transposase [Candidatus Formimonas warabiya]ATW28200.1 DDE transposase [Candidatus Formimonas warabiya]
MYRKRNRKQITLVENFFLPFGGKLNKNNRWVKLAEIIPWDTIEEKYAATFSDNGAPGKPVRMALGAIIIKERLGLSDEETLQQIIENPYLQLFIGLQEYTNAAPFDASLMVHFRKRFDLKTMQEINEMICLKEKEANQRGKDDPPSTGGSSPDQTTKEHSTCASIENTNKGNLILDATCAPADIHYPTDTWLLNEAREKLEDIMDELHQPLVGKVKKPRNYREKAHKEYLRFTKKRKPNKKAIRKALSKQLRYIKRDLKIIEILSHQSSLSLLSRQQYKELLVIQEIFRQQTLMYQTGTHQVDDRIVNISQPHIRPIVRGKVSAEVEFGAKVTISVKDGLAFIETLSFDNYNESKILIESAEKHKQRFGCYPEAIMADKIFRNRENLQFCKINHIRLSGPRLGRPSAKELEEHRQHQRSDESIRNVVEAKFGEGKRKYGLGRIMARLQETSECVIALQFLVMNLEYKLRKLFLLFFKDQFMFSFFNLAWSV